MTNWTPEQIALITRALRNGYNGPGPRSLDERWTQAAVAALEEAERVTDVLTIETGDRSIVLPAPDPVEWVDKDQIRAGMGPEGCLARRSENPNWLLGHASNILALYRVLAGQNPWPDDPAEVERKRMTDVVNRMSFESYSAIELARALQDAGFKLPEQPAA